MSDFVVNYAKIMRAEMDRLSSIALNTSNAHTTGYLSKTSAIDGAAFNALLEGKYQPLVANSFSLNSAAVEKTGNSADLAIKGDGFFLLTDGTNFFATRNGKTKINSDNTMVHSSGLSFVGESGGPVGLNKDFSVNSDGSIVSSGANLGRLKVVQINDASEHLQSSGGLIQLSSGGFTDAQHYQVEQGYLTASNVDVADQMTQLMTATRHLESVQRAILAYDNILDAGINQLGK